MKLYIKSGIFAAGLLLATSCAVNDPFADNMEMGQVVPTVTWELSSTVCKAGNEAEFLAKYYTTEKDVTIDHSEVWGMLTVTESAAATAKLVSSPSYTKTVSFTDTVRNSYLLATYPHSLATLEGNEYHMTASFPTSRTLGPVTWATPSQWDDDTFNSYYPDGFKEEFCSQMVSYMTADSTYLSSLRTIYVTYDFTAEQFDAVNAKYSTLTPLPFPADGEDKGDLWFNVDTETITGYYYIVVDAAGNAVEVEIANISDAPAGVTEDQIFPVYKSPHWIFSRYSDNTGGAVTSVRAEYMPMWKELLEMIPFEGWIYNSSDANYAVEFTRKYSMGVQFKVVDSKGGVGKDTEVKTVELN